jgi:hypothetical protein
MVESEPVGTVNEGPAQGPIGVLASLAKGFDRVAARPVLILPPLVLDLFLWLGPRLGIAPFVRATASSLTAPPGADALVQQQIASMQEIFNQLAVRLNLLRSLSSLPVGIPSVMAGQMPLNAPLKIGPQIELSEPVAILGLWMLITVVGLGLGTWYHRMLAASVAHDTDLTPLAMGWLKMVLAAVIGYVGLVLGTAAIFVLGWAAGWILPLLGVGVSFVAFSLFFWLVVYLVFTPHGIVRYRMGLFSAMTESVLLVRWNFLPTVGFLTLAVAISWLTGWVWSLPQPGSWISSLSILGHAFVSAMLLVSSYVFYQGRREWLIRTRHALEQQLKKFQQAAQMGPEPDMGREEGET